MKKVKYLIAIIFSLFIIGPFTVQAEEIQACNLDDIVTIRGVIKSNAKDCDRVIVSSTKNLDIIYKLDWIK